MKIRISRITGYRDITPRFSVEVQEMRQPVIQEVVLINGIQFTSGQPERLEWVPCQDRVILEQVYNGGIVKWFSQQMSVITALVIEVDELGRVIKAYNQVKDIHYHTIFDNERNPCKSISQVIQLLCVD